MTPYWGYTLNFFAIIFNIGSIPDALIIFLSSAFVGFVHITWMFAFSDFFFKNLQKRFMAVAIFEAVTYEIFLLNLFVSNLPSVGVLEGPFFIRWGELVTFFLFFSIFMMLVMGMVFARETLKSDSIEVKLKGKFLFAAFISFTTGTFIDILTFGLDYDTAQIVLIFARIIVISAAFEFYLGFILPNFVKNLFIKLSKAI